MRGWRPALRIAWRETRRAKGRAALVVGLILLPVAALSFTAVSYDSFTLTPDETADRLMGQTQAYLSWPYSGPVIQEPDQAFALPANNSGTTGAQQEPSEADLLTHLPAGTRLVPAQTGTLSVHTAAGLGTITTSMIDHGDPLAAGILNQVEGRPAATNDEANLTPTAVTRTGVGLGGTLRAEDGRTFQVVGIVEEPSRLDNSTIVLRPGAIPVTRNGTSWLSTSPLTWSQIKDLNKLGIAGVSRDVLHNPPSPSERYQQFGRDNEVGADVLILVGGVAMLEMVLLAGPALAVGARRRRRDLALVAASGGTPAHVRRIVLADGLVLGAVAALGGVILGVVSAVAARPVVEMFVDERAGAQRFYPAALLGLAVLAVVTGVLAALVPAWISSRQDVVAALAGRRGVTRSKRRWVVAGLVLFALGVAVGAVGALKVEPVIILYGLVITVLGLVLCTPSLVGLVARFGGWLPVALRIALRDTSRNRTAAAPAISAVMAAVIGSLAVGIILNSGTVREANQSAGNVGDVAIYNSRARDLSGQDIPQSVVDAMKSTLPIAEAHVIKLMTCNGGPCFAHPRPPADKECPYTRDVLRREATEEEQRAARSDSRCEGAGRFFEYFNALGSPVGIVVVVKPEAARAVTGLKADDGMSDALRSGKVLVSSPTYLANDTVRISMGMSDPGAEPRVISVPAVAMPAEPKAPIALMTEETASSLGFGASTFSLFATTTREPTVEEADRLAATLASEYEVRVQRAAESDLQQMLTVLALAAGVITLGAAALATGLAAADGRADLTTLAAVGASPALRRLLSLSQSGVIAGLGSVLGTVIGVGASIAVLTALNQGYAEQWPTPTLYPITVPWLNVATALLLIPLVAMLGAGLLTRSRLPIERRE